MPGGQPDATRDSWATVDGGHEPTTHDHGKGIGADWNMSAYNAAKGAVNNFTRAVALDHGADGVRVNAVAPSLTRTEMTASMQDDDELLASFAERIPMRRQAEPEEIASVIAFLAGDDARFVTGVVLPVDGGLSASNGQPKQA